MGKGNQGAVGIKVPVSGTDFMSLTVVGCRGFGIAWIDASTPYYLFENTDVYKKKMIFELQCFWQGF